MKAKQYRSAMTLVEILVVVALVIILVGIAASVGLVSERKAQERLAAGQIELIETALEDFAAYGYRFDVIDRTETDPTTDGYKEKAFYRSLKFPLDCNYFAIGDIIDELKDVLDIHPDNTRDTEVVITGTFKPKYADSDAGSSVLYYFLNQVPQCRKTLERIDSKLVTNLGNNVEMTITTTPPDGDPRVSPFFRFIDPWGTPLNYDYYINEVEDNSLDWDERLLTKRNFPKITSAGPDKTFGTNDDIVSDKR